MINPVIVLPGITGSTLMDSYPLDPELLWNGSSKKNFDRISLHPDNLLYEAREPARVTSTRVVGLIYDELVAALRHELTLKPDKPTPVYQFPYDWRQPLAHCVQLLDAFVEEVIERTKLLRHYDRDGYADDPKVNLVGHSMGGLIMAGYIAHCIDAGKPARVGKVATLGTPFLGSHEAVVKVTRGGDNLNGETSPIRERESARVTPSIYHLVPSYKGAAAASGSNVDLFDSSNWQRSVVQSISEYIRMYGQGKSSERKENAEALFEQFLRGAGSFLKRQKTLDLSGAGLSQKDWLCIVGIDAKTRIRTEVEFLSGDRIHFDLNDDRDVINLYDKEGASVAQRVLTGDSTVPYLGAKPPFLDARHLVCVSRADFGALEIVDRGLSLATGLHASLPLMNNAQRLVACHLLGKKRKDFVGRPGPDVKAEEWDPPWN
ncbi:esterase/lipase family protein [Haliea sp. E17]|uniref:esterase/lipase family protein n=1 Tax=Haliea sp. E17 TaxID=3401576 RepID=UPI003AAEFEA3